MGLHTLVSIVEKRLFGVPLNTLLENDQKLLPNTKVPLLLQAVSSLLVSFTPLLLRVRSL